MGVAAKARHAATLRRFWPNLVGPAARTLASRKSWRRDLGSQRDWAETRARGRYSEGGASPDADYLWWGAFKARREEIGDYLELGSWEGQSAVLAAWLFPKAQITAVDWFANEEAEANFDYNTEPFADRVEKVRGTTYDVLPRLREEGRSFDLVYIDADHRFDAVLLDTVLSWSLVRVGGYLIWDDYLWGDPQIAPLYTKPAIDAWLSTRSPFYEVVFAEQEVCVRKTAPDPEIQDMAYTVSVNTA
jgi:hypothetical protein